MASGETTTTRRGRPRVLARLTSAVGVFVALAGAVFVARAIARDQDEVTEALAGATPAWLALALVLGLAAMTGIGLAWRKAMALVGWPTDWRPALRWYFLGQLGKYVPGGIWPVVGRAELARRGGVGRPAAYGSVILSLVATYMGAVVMVALLLPFDFTAQRGSLVVLGVAAALPVGLLALHPRVLGQARSLVGRLGRRPVEVPVPGWADSVALVARHVPSWLLIATATWAVARALDPDVGFANVAVATVVSWVVGFVAVPVPGGIGVREATFAAIAATSLGPAVAAAVAIAARLVFVLVDALGALLAAAVATGKSRSPSGGLPSGDREGS